MLVAIRLREEAVHFPAVTMHPTLFHRGDKMNLLSPWGHYPGLTAAWPSIHRFHRSWGCAGAQQWGGRARLPPAVLQGGPWAWFCLLSSFLLCWPCQQTILWGGSWMGCWDKSWNEEKNIQCSGEGENGEGNKVTVYPPNFLEARSYFKSQYPLCFLPHLFWQWAPAWVL